MSHSLSALRPDAPIRVALADDHPIVLDGLEQLFRLEADIDVVARCRTADEALRALRAVSPDVLVLDLLMPGGGGLELLRAMGEKDRRTRIILLTAVIDDDQLLEAIRLGAQGVVLKDMAPQLLLDAIREVHAGGQWLERGLGGRALRRLLSREQRASETARRLSSREREIVRLVAGGLRNRAIADRLSISEGTVKVHMHNIYEKLDLNGRVELANYARENGLM
ncbi:MAG: response regulator transcription factor [Acidobacteriota bacterium]|nr:response regulator transcription factor [Acidobacteriota bacterium]